MYVAAANNVEFAIRLLSAIAGNDKVKVVVELFIRQSSQTSLFAGTALLIRIREYIRSKKLNTCISEPTYGERNISGTASEKVISEITTDNPEDVTTACSATAEKDLPIQTNDMDLNEVRTAFEQHLDDISGITEWLRNRAFSSAQKRMCSAVI